MAIEFNVEGATTFAAAGWSGSGFVDTATLVAANPGGPIIAGQDQKAANIVSLEVLSGFAADIGSPLNPLKFEANTNATDYFRYHPGGGQCWVAAEDATAAAKIENLDVGGSGRITLVGGEFEDVTQSAGHIHSGQNSTTDNFRTYGGTSRWEIHGTDLTLVEAYGGVHTIERGCTTLTIGGPGTTVILDAPGESITTLNMNGGLLIVRAGNVATVNGNAGEIDCTRADRAILLGTTSFVQGGVRVKYDARTTISNVTKPGAFLPPQPI